MGALLSRFPSQPSPPSQCHPKQRLITDDIINQPLSAVSFIPDPLIPSTPIPIPNAPSVHRPTPNLYSLSPEEGGPLSSYDQARLDRLFPIDRWRWEAATRK
ncbi:hypothetical protein PRIPAC_89192 [Pristionchus pacificus]|uniref:Uncharacterized protein n=1 Tax=Pristionchus pacificus TaxID=54126 RepID=A0A2A6CVH1_PRIPA|nr:hypothetical protein PRIPAC_89192 [Pristionchus pacificus]|eukprot:PDM82159.1 hypothetical protein PRIPAC_36552 [Pristionchus pacificus]